MIPSQKSSLIESELVATVQVRVGTETAEIETTETEATETQTTGNQTTRSQTTGAQTIASEALTAQIAIDSTTKAFESKTIVNNVTEALATKLLNREQIVTEAFDKIFNDEGNIFRQNQIIWSLVPDNYTSQPEITNLRIANSNDLPTFDKSEEETTTTFNVDETSTYTNSTKISVHSITEVYTKICSN